MVIVDAQVHIWREVQAGRRPQRPEPFSASELLGLMDACGVDRTLLAPTSWSADGEDGNDLVVQAVRDHPSRFRAIGVLDIEDPRSPDRPVQWRSRGLLGLCLRFHHPHLAKLFEAAAWVWPAAEQAGVPLTVNAPHHLPNIGQVAASHPGLKIAVDHLGLPGDSHDIAGQVDQLVGLARFDNVAVKADGLLTHSQEPYPFADLQPHLCRVLEAFGPERVFWGSDLTRSWQPGCSLAANYQQAVGFIRDELACLAGHDRELVMGRAAMDWFGWA